MDTIKGRIATSAIAGGAGGLTSAFASAGLYQHRLPTFNELVDNTAHYAAFGGALGGVGEAASLSADRFNLATGRGVTVNQFKRFSESNGRELPTLDNAEHLKNMGGASHPELYQQIDTPPSTRFRIPDWQPGVVIPRDFQQIDTPTPSTATHPENDQSGVVAPYKFPPMDIRDATMDTPPSRPFVRESYQPGVVIPFESAPIDVRDATMDTPPSRAFVPENYQQGVVAPYKFPPMDIRDATMDTPPSRPFVREDYQQRYFNAFKSAAVDVLNATRRGIIGYTQEAELQSAMGLPAEDPLASLFESYNVSATERVKIRNAVVAADVSPFSLNKIAELARQQSNPIATVESALTWLHGGSLPSELEPFRGQTVRDFLHSATGNDEAAEALIRHELDRSSKMPDEEFSALLSIIRQSRTGAIALIPAENPFNPDGKVDICVACTSAFLTTRLADSNQLLKMIEQNATQSSAPRAGLAPLDTPVIPVNAKGQPFLTGDHVQNQFGDVSAKSGFDSSDTATNPSSSHDYMEKVTGRTLTRVEPESLTNGTATPGYYAIVSEPSTINTGRGTIDSTHAFAAEASADGTVTYYDPLHTSDALENPPRPPGVVYHLSD